MNADSLGVIISEPDSEGFGKSAIISNCHVFLCWIVSGRAKYRLWYTTLYANHGMPCQRKSWNDVSEGLCEHSIRFKVPFEISRCETIHKSGLESKDDLSKDKINNSPSPMRRGFVVGSEYKLETFWLRSQLKRNIVSIKWQNNWTEKKNNPG